MQPANVQTYVDEWVKVASDGNITVKYAWHPAVNRMLLSCRVCNQALDCAIPEVPEKIDYALQKFGGLHRHAAFVPPTQTSNWNPAPRAPRPAPRAPRPAPYTATSPVKVNRATLIDEEGRRFRE